MKKIWKFLLVFSIVSAGLIFTSTTASAPKGGWNDVRTTTIYSDGMTYKVFTQHTTTGGSISIDVVNVTKDKLEIQKLKAEIDYYNKIK